EIRRYPEIDAIVISKLRYLLDQCLLREGQGEIDFIDILPDAKVFYFIQVPLDQRCTDGARIVVVEETFELIPGEIMGFEKILDRFSGSGGANNNETALIETRELQVFGDKLICDPGSHDQNYGKQVSAQNEVYGHPVWFECKHDRPEKSRVNNKNTHQVSTNSFQQAELVEVVDLVKPGDYPAQTENQQKGSALFG